MKKDTGKLRELMNGHEYKNHRDETVKVIQVCVSGRGHSVVFNYGAQHNVFCGLGSFLKRYPIKVTA